MLGVIEVLKAHKGYALLGLPVLGLPVLGPA
jgi:hypothetical protein